MSSTQLPATAIMARDAVALIQGLVEIPSFSRDERAAVGFLTREMSRLGLIANTDDAGNAIGMRSNGVPNCDIVLLGHIDTVQGGIPVRIEDGVLYGRGAVDAKGPLAAFVIAAAQANLPPGVRVIVVGAVEEEIATSRGARFVATQYQPAACIIGEPSAVNGVTLGYKGRLLARVVARCETSHSAGPAPTAAELVTDWWTAARKLTQEKNAGQERVFDQVQSRLREIQTFIDGDSEVCAAEIGFRLPPSATPETLSEELMALKESAGLEVTFAGQERAHQSGRQDPVARALSHAVRTRGMTPAPKLKTGTSDMNVVAPIWKCPIAAYGAGDSLLDHTPREHLVLSEYLESISVLTLAIETLAAELTSVTL